MSIAELEPVRLKPKPNGHVAKPASNGEAIHEQEIPLSAIADSPYQRRAKSAGDDLKDVKTIATVGLLHAVTVRPKGKGFELVCGHRRCAAARALKWKTIRARVCHVDDARAQEILMIENADREGLSAIEEAHEYQDWLKLHPNSTQFELAALMKVSQGHVANRIRMLKMPAAWQEAIISGEIPATYSRAILPYCDDPRAAAAIAKVRKTFAPTKADIKAAAGEPPIPSYDNLRDDLYHAFRNLGIEVGRYHGQHDKKTGKYIELPEKLSDEQRKKLDVITVETSLGHREKMTVEIALNRSAWFEIAREHYEKREARQAGKASKKADKPAESMTLAERKAAAAEDAKRKKVRREQLERRRGEIGDDWKRLLIAEALNDAKRTSREVLTVCLCYMTHQWKVDGWPLRVDFEELADVKDCRASNRHETFIERLASGRGDEDIWVIARKYVRRAFVDDKGAPMSTIVDGDDLNALVGWLSIDLAAAWEASQMGVLSEAWWNAHDREDLARIGGGICVDSHMKKGEAVSSLCSCSGNSIPFPAELQPEKKNKRKPR